MGNSQFNSAKDGEAGSGRDGGGFSSYPETLTTPGAPGPFSDAGFAPSSRPGDGGRHGYAGVAGGRNTALEGGGPAAAAGPRVSGTAAGDAMDVEPKADEGEEEEQLVPTVFRWEHGGRQVYITGTFNNWEKQIPMHRSGNDFTYIHTLKKGKHAFKFIVDDEWRFAPDQPTVADIEGRVNNFIDVSDFVGYTGEENFESNRMKQAEANDQYSQCTPDLDEYTKEPPPLPPHLRHIILNKNPPANDPSALPVPQHVALNHLYCTAIKDGMMVLGMTERYKQKFVTTVYYSTMPG
ncbi:unnamed protein product [Pylaiella littoralis]